jgi:XTP/dITP diphosphohydrolase
MKKKLWLASGNSHKKIEIGQILGEDWLVCDLKDCPQCESPEETGVTFAENAVIKALALSRHLPGQWVMADDSGLVVDALKGAPGVYSARYAGVGASDADNRHKLQEELERLGVKSSSAYFCCSLCLVRDEEVYCSEEGKVYGSVQLQAKGSHGFGYDPLFIADGYSVTMAEMSDDEKNAISHRGQALKKMRVHLQKLSVD